MIGATLRGLRKASGLTLKDVEEKSGVSNAYLSQLETGKITSPGPQIITKIAPAYGLSVDQMLRLAGYTDLTGDLPDLTPVPAWVREAADVLTPDDWGALRPTVEWLAALRRAQAVPQ